MMVRSLQQSNGDVMEQIVVEADMLHLTGSSGVSSKVLFFGPSMHLVSIVPLDRVPLK